MTWGEIWVILAILSAGCFIAGALALWEKRRRKSCELCKLVEGKIKTKSYYRDSEFIIVDCLTCRIPMLVFKHHGQSDEGQRRRGLNAVDTLFEYKEIRKEPRSIFDHEHWHIYGAKATQRYSACDTRRAQEQRKGGIE